MTGECYYCHGIVLPEEPGDVLLADHDDHRVYLHLECATGQNVAEPADEGGDRLAITCPECGVAETQ
ncbi:hypothetical protein [Halomarina rubra]|uniref:Small CPxCG-related zinc finger protein n=1 Tax=Halomarina rubra TaxID=2071873 RepID=A0ABD6AX54_9EURY|nr:hypothetical protein [Halomarina rubra]